MCTHGRQRHIGAVTLRDLRVIFEHQIQDPRPKLDQAVGQFGFRLTGRGQYFQDLLEPWNSAQEFLRNQGCAVGKHPLFGRQAFAVVKLFHQLDRQRYVSDLRKHGRRFELPETRFAERCGQLGGKTLDPRGPSEGNGIGHGEDVDQRLDAADQGLLQQHFFSDQQPVMQHPGFNRAAQLVGGTGLGQEPENLALVDGRDGGVASCLSSQQNARRFRVELPDVFEQRCAVHSGHPHVGNDDGGRALLFEHLQSAIAAIGREHLVVAAQMHRQAVHDSWLIVHTENAGEFFAIHMSAVILLH